MGRVAPSAWADPHALPVHGNATVTSSGFLVQPGYGMKEITLVVNLTGAITGTSPTIQYSLQEVDPGDQSTTMGTAVTTAQLTTNGLTTITLRTTQSGFVRVTWTVTGLSPSFAGVYATLTAKATTVMSALDPDAAEVSVTVDDGGKLRSALQAYSGSYPDPSSHPDGLYEASVDGFGNLMTRGPVLTDEQSFRDDFIGSSLTTSLTGTLSWTSGSETVEGVGTSFTTEVKVGQYIKKTADAESAYVQVSSVESDTLIILHNPYAGTTGSATGVVNNWKTNTGTGGSISVGSSLVTLATGTTSGATTSLFREVDYGPFTILIQASVSQRIANQYFRIGFSDQASTTPEVAAYFEFSGTSNTVVDCITQSSSSPSDTQTTTVSLPEGLTSASPTQYRIDVSNNTVTFIVAGDIVARHELHIPGPYQVLGAFMLASNTGAVGSSTDFSANIISVQNFDLLQTTTTFTGEPIPVEAIDTVAVGTLSALNSAITLELNGNQGAGFHLAAGTLIGTIVPEISYNGSQWTQTQFLEPTGPSVSVSITFAASNPSTARSLIVPSGAGYARVRVSAYTSGSAAGTIRGSQVAPSTTSITRIDGQKASYSASVQQLAVANNATDVFTITGSSTRTVRVTRIEISGTRTTASQVLIVLLRRTTANTGGASTTPTAVSMDAQDAAATAVVRAYTTNPGGLGTLLGSVRNVFVPVPAPATATVSNPYVWNFGDGPGNKAIVLRGTNDVLSINLNSTTIAGGSFNFSIDWTEEPS